MNGVAEVTGRLVIGLDVWEHAYYLKYQNLRPSYIEAFWNLVDWNAAEANYQAAKVERYGKTLLTKAVPLTGAAAFLCPKRDPFNCDISSKSAFRIR